MCSGQCHPLEGYGWADTEMFIPGYTLHSFSDPVHCFLTTHTLVMMLVPTCSNSSSHRHKHTVFSRQGCHLPWRSLSHGQMHGAAGRFYVGSRVCSLPVLYFSQIRALRGSLVTMGLMQSWSPSTYVYLTVPLTVQGSHSALHY